RSGGRRHGDYLSVPASEAIQPAAERQRLRDPGRRRARGAGVLLYLAQGSPHDGARVEPQARHRREAGGSVEGRIGCRRGVGGGVVSGLRPSGLSDGPTATDPREIASRLLVIESPVMRAASKLERDAARRRSTAQRRQQDRRARRSKLTPGQSTAPRTSSRRSLAGHAEAAAAAVGASMVPARAAA